MLFTGSLINLIIIRYLCDVKNRLGIPSVTVAVILAVVLLNIVVFYYTPLYGDDLTYKSFFEGPSTRWTGPLGWLRWLWMHWNSINGRLGNFVIIPLLALPPGVACRCSRRLFRTLFLGPVSPGGAFHRPTRSGGHDGHDSAARRWYALV